MNRRDTGRPRRHTRAYWSRWASARNPRHYNFDRAFRDIQPQRAEPSFGGDISHREEIVTRRFGRLTTLSEESSRELSSQISVLRSSLNNFLEEMHTSMINFAEEISERLDSLEDTIGASASASLDRPSAEPQFRFADPIVVDVIPEVEAEELMPEAPENIPDVDLPAGMSEDEHGQTSQQSSSVIASDAASAAQQSSSAGAAAGQQFSSVGASAVAPPDSSVIASDAASAAQQSSSAGSAAGQQSSSVGASAVAPPDSSVIASDAASAAQQSSSAGAAAGQQFSSVGASAVAPPDSSVIASDAASAAQQSSSAGSAAGQQSSSVGASAVAPPDGSYDNRPSGLGSSPDDDDDDDDDDEDHITRSRQKVPAPASKYIVNPALPIECGSKEVVVIDAPKESGSSKIDESRKSAKRTLESDKDTNAPSKKFKDIRDFFVRGGQPVASTPREAIRQADRDQVQRLIDHFTNAWRNSIQVSQPGNVSQPASGTQPEPAQDDEEEIDDPYAELPDVHADPGSVHSVNLENQNLASEESFAADDPIDQDISDADDMPDVAANLPLVPVITAPLPIQAPVLAPSLHPQNIPVPAHPQINPVNATATLPSVIIQGPIQGQPIAHNKRQKLANRKITLSPISLRPIVSSQNAPLRRSERQRRAVERYIPETQSLERIISRRTERAERERRRRRR